MNGGEARRVTNLKNGVSTFRWSPDGSRFVIVSRVGPSDSRAENRDAATCATTKTRRTNSTTPAGSMIAARICGLSM